MTWGKNNNNDKVDIKSYFMECYTILKNRSSMQTIDLNYIVLEPKDFGTNQKKKKIAIQVSDFRAVELNTIY